ncbi:MAG: hypothetical protein OXF79_15245 [Chloroflexi bacterium]|nr:hypothetical protein [Chloroflexota bacterium]
MNEPDAPQSASAEEEARIAETPAVFANKVFVWTQPGGAKITIAEARRTSGEGLASPRVAVFLRHADLAALRRLLDWTAGIDTQLRPPAVRCSEPQGTVRTPRAHHIV